MQDCAGILDCWSQPEDKTDSCDQGVVGHAIGGAEIEHSNEPLSPGNLHDARSDTISDTAGSDTIDTAALADQPVGK